LLQLKIGKDAPWSKNERYGERLGGYLLSEVADRNFPGEVKSISFRDTARILQKYVERKMEPKEKDQLSRRDGGKSALPPEMISLLT